MLEGSVGYPTREGHMRTSDCTSLPICTCEAGLFARLGFLAMSPVTAVRRGVDSMKMTALSAWAVDELGHAGADQVEVSWTFDNPDVEVSASFFGESTFTARTSGRRDTAVMSAVSQIIDDHVEALSTARQRLTSSEPWWHVLGVTPDATRPEVEKAHRALALQVHPDLGGLAAEMVRVNVARDAALQAIH